MLKELSQFQKNLQESEDYAFEYQESLLKNIFCFPDSWVDKLSLLDISFSTEKVRILIDSGLDGHKEIKDETTLEDFLFWLKKIKKSKKNENPY